MGDRLVISIRHQGEFFAGAYMHWAASDWEVVDEILTKHLDNACFHDADTVRTKKLAVEILQKTLDEYNNSVEAIDAGLKVCKAGLVKDWIIGLENRKPYESEETVKFLQENDFIGEGTDHNAYITIDEHIWFDWNGWAEDVLDVDFDHRDINIIREEMVKKADALREWEEQWITS